MARMFPDRPRPDATRGERKTFDALRGLDDAWHVLHSVTFVAQDRGRNRPGEADFVLLHPRLGMIILEVKDRLYRIAGRVWHEKHAGGWVSVSRSPFDQATDNRYKLRNFILEATGLQVPSGHCVMFTSGSPSGALGPEAPPAIVLTGAQLPELKLAISTAANHWFPTKWNATQQQFASVVGALMPSAVVAPTLQYDMQLATAELERLTDRQIQLTDEQLDVLQRTSRKRDAVVLGAAGTGKTLLAHHRARHLAREHRRVGLIAQERHLRLATRRALQLPDVLAGTPEEVLDAAFDAATAEENQPLWERALALVEEHGPPLDYLIIDEAQAFEIDELIAFSELVRADGAVTYFADPYQRDSTGTWRPPGDISEFWLTQNCRNTLPIARLVSRLSGALPPVDGASGRKPVLIREPVSKNLSKTTAEVTAALVRELGVGNVVVLARSGLCGALQRELKIAGVPLSRESGEDGVLICGADAFRGSEAPVVVYMADGASSDRTVDYIAVSRGCSHVVVVADPGSWRELAYLLEVNDAPVG